MAEGGQSNSTRSGKWKKELEMSPEPTMPVRHWKQKSLPQESLPQDPDLLSKGQKAQKLNRFLNKRCVSRRDKPVTRSSVNEEYRKILEQFLQHQLDKHDIQTKPQPGRYQRVVKVDVKEQTSHGDSVESFKNLPTIFVRGDSIPFADETDDDVEDDGSKIASVPFDFFSQTGGSLTNGQREIHHEKSRSAPHTSIDEYRGEISLISRRNKPYPAVPPPPPPCTPHSETENSQSHDSSPVPFTRYAEQTDEDGRSNHQSSSQGSLDMGKARPAIPKEPANKPSPPTTLDIRSHAKEKERTKTPLTESDLTSHSRSSSSPGKENHNFSLNRQQNRMSGSLSSDESSASLDRFDGRRKKSLFKKARERISHFLKMKKDGSESPPGHSSTYDIVKPKKFKKRVKTKSKHEDEGDMYGDDDEADVYIAGRMSSSDVLEKKHIHTKRHIHQHHSGEDGSKVVRVEEIDQVIDVDRNKERKHTEKHWTVKESREDSSIIGKLRKITSGSQKKKKSKKSKMKESKSDHFADQRSHDGLNFSRTISVPANGQEDGKHNRRVIVGGDNSIDVADVWKQSTGDVRQTNATRVVSKNEDELKRHSSHLDIIDADGSILQRLWYENPDCLPRNKSFEFEGDTCIHERKVRQGGHVTTERDVDTHQHFHITDDDIGVDGVIVDTNQNVENNETGEEMTEQELEEMYEKIAERLAMIGDDYMTRKEKQQASGADKTDVMKKSTLNPLEQEISDCLHIVAKDIDDKMSDTARQATLQLARQVTYSQFKDVVQDAVGSQMGGINQVGALLHVTNRAVQLAGAGGALALQIKDLSLRYFEDKFAGWIVEKGGWETMLSETEDEVD